MSPRRAVVGLASAFLLVLFLRNDDPGELRRRAQTLGHSTRNELAVRRLHGSATAFDRQFFAFLESARRGLPPGTRGVAIVGAQPSDQVVHLATYHFAPTPVLIAPARIPPGWLLAVYGPERPPGWKVIVPVWKGALMAPAS